MKTSNKLLIGLPVVFLLTIAFCLQIAGEYKEAGVVSTTEYNVSQSGRIPAFSIITIKGRAFTARQPEANETEQEPTSIAAHTNEQTPALWPLAFQTISKTLLSGK